MPNDRIAAALELKRRVDFGLAVENVLHSDIGNRLREDIESESTKLMEQIVSLDADDEADRKKIRALKFQLGVLEQGMALFARYVADGHAAAHELQEGEYEFDQDGNPVY